MNEVSSSVLKDVIQWDIVNWSKALAHWKAHAAIEPGMKVLELGGRQGGLSLWFALNGCQVTCSDFKDTRALALPLHEKYGVSHLVTYEDIDATNIPYENHFDVIVFKSIIGGIGYGNNIERQLAVFRQIEKALKPGGKLLFAENMIASPFHRFMRKRFVSWGADWRYLTLAEMRNMLEGFEIDSLRTTGVMATFGRSEGQRKFLGMIDKALSPLTPPEWRYIVYGVAKKPE